MSHSLTMKAVFYFLIGVAIYFFYLLASIPANFAINKFLPGNISSSINYTNSSGTLWSGKLAGLSVKKIDLGKVNWELSAIPLIWGSTNLHLTARRDDALLRTRALLKEGQLQLGNTELEIPVSDLMPLLYGLPISFDGNFRAHFKDIIIEPGKQLTIKGRAVLTDVKLVAPQALSLGNFIIQFEAEENGTRITINDEQGPVAVDAVVNLSGAGRYTFKSTFTPQPSADDTIKNSLVMLGNADSQGRHSISYSGVLPIKF